MKTNVQKIFEQLTEKANKGKLKAEEIAAFKSLIDSLDISKTTKEKYLEEADSLLLGSNVTKIMADDVKVGGNERHFKVNKKKVATVAALVAAGGIVIFAGTHLKGCSNSKALANSNATIEQDIEQDSSITALKPTLAFDAENTDVLIANLEATARDMIAKGIAMEDATLEETVESLTNYYVWMNLNEMGPTYLSELYQSDSISYMKIFQDSMYWTNAIRFDSMTSSKEQETVLDMSNFIANKKDAALTQEFLDINARLSDAVAKNDKDTINSIVAEYRTLIETKLLDHSSYTYGGGTMDLCFRLVYSGEQLLQNYDITIMDEGLSKIINEDEFLLCYHQVVVATKDVNSVMEVTELQTVVENNTSKKSDNVIYIVDTLKDKFSRLNMALDFTGKKSIANVMIEVSKDLRDNNVLDTYKPNMSLEEYFNHNYDLTHQKQDEIPKGATITTDGNHYIDESEMNKHQATTEEGYKENVKQETEDKLKDESTFTDNDGNTLNKGDDSEAYAKAYSDGYTSGSLQGAIDGNALATFNNSVSGTKGYQDGYRKGYIESYVEPYVESFVNSFIKEYRESWIESYHKSFLKSYLTSYFKSCGINYDILCMDLYIESCIEKELKNQSSITTITPVENGESTDEVMEQGTVTSSKTETNSNVSNGTTDSNDSNNLPPIGTVVEEEVIESGTVGYSYTPSEAELYKIYTDVLNELLYGTDDSYSYEKVKTR